MGPSPKTNTCRRVTRTITTEAGTITETYSSEVPSFEEFEREAERHFAAREQSWRDSDL